MVILSKGCKPDNIESNNSLELSSTNIQGLHSNCVECESFLESNFPDILALCETNLDDSIDSGKFLCEGLSSFNPKGFCHSYAWSCNLCEARTSFARDLPLENSADSYLCFQMILLHSMCCFFLY